MTCHRTVPLGFIVQALQVEYTTNDSSRYQKLSGRRLREAGNTYLLLPLDEYEGLEGR